MSFRILLASCLLAMLTACGPTERAPLTVADLRLPLDGFAGIERIEDKSVFIDDYADGAPVPVPAQALRNQGIASSAYYKYWVAGDAKAAYKVKMNVYTGRDALLADWARRYPEAALQGTTPLKRGDGGFRYGDKIAAFHADNVMVAIEASGGAGALGDFFDTYAAFVLETID